MNELGLIKWVDDSKPDNIDLESIYGATAWLDAEGNIHEIKREVVEYMTYEDEKKDIKDFTIPELLERIDELVSNEQGYIEEISRLRKELEDNQNE